MSSPIKVENESRSRSVRVRVFVAAFAFFVCSITALPLNAVTVTTATTRGAHPPVLRIAALANATRTGLTAFWGSEGFISPLAGPSAKDEKLGPRILVTILVDDDGQASAGDCNDISPVFDTIQEGVDAAATGDTISVCPGVYLGDVNVNKSVILHGAQVGVNPSDVNWNDTRTVPANESSVQGAVNLSLQNNIVMDGFTLERTEANDGHILIGAANPIGIGTTSSFNLRNNRFVGTRNTASPGSPWGGIHTNFLNDAAGVNPGNQFTGHQNRFQIAGASSGVGILINGNRPGSDGLGSTTITANYVTGSPSNGLNVNRSGAFLTLTGNHLVNDDIFTFQVHNGMISGNTVIDSPQGGIQVVASATEDASDVTVTNNRVTKNVSTITNNFSQIDMRGPLSGTNVVSNNTVILTGSVPGGIAGVYGVRVRGTTTAAGLGLTVTGNSLAGGGVGGAGNATFPPTSGVWVDTDLLTASLDLDVTSNTIYGWVNGASIFDSVPGANTAAAPTFTCNNIFLNAIGVYLDSAATNGAIIGGTDGVGNNIVDNTVGVQNDSATLVDAQYNYWGSATGPTNAGNPGGTGDSVIGNVDFSPFKTTLVTCAPVTAANVSVSGRISTAEAQGITNVRVSLADSNGVVRSALSSGFGYYTFTDVPAGRTYVISVAAKRYVFDPPSRVIVVNDDLANIDFTASGPIGRK